MLFPLHGALANRLELTAAQCNARSWAKAQCLQLWRASLPKVAKSSPYRKLNQTARALRFQLRIYSLKKSDEPDPTVWLHQKNHQSFLKMPIFRNTNIKPSNQNAQAFNQSVSSVPMAMSMMVDSMVNMMQNNLQCNSSNSNFSQSKNQWILSNLLLKVLANGARCAQAIP